MIVQSVPCRRIMPDQAGCNGGRGRPLRVRNSCSCCQPMNPGRSLFHHATTTAVMLVLCLCANGGPPVIQCECRWAGEPIIIDGRADEAAWRAAAVIENFAQHWLPKPGTAPAPTS